MNKTEMTEAQVNEHLRKKTGKKEWMLWSDLQWFAYVDSITKLKAIGDGQEIALNTLVSLIKSISKARKHYIGVPFGQIKPLSEEDKRLLEAEMAPHKGHSKQYKYIDDNFDRIIGFRSNGASMSQVYNILMKTDKFKITRQTFYSVFLKVQANKMKKAPDPTPINNKEHSDELEQEA